MRPDAGTTSAILGALDDDRFAEAQYQAVLTVYGSIQPFANVVAVERQREAALIGLVTKYGIPVPENPWDPSEMSVPGTLKEACLVGVAAEKANIAMYDRLLTFVALRDVRNVFTNLRAASLNNHLPAFEACAETRPIGRPGPGRR